MPLFLNSKQRAMQAYAEQLKREIYQLDSISWATERFGEPLRTFRWSDYPGYENHVWDGTPDPFEKAMVALSNGRWVGIESATGTGKTYLLPRIIYWYLDVFPNSFVVTTAPTGGQLKDVLWKEIGNAYSKFKRIHTYSDMQTLKLIVDKRAKLNTIGKQNDIDEFNLGHECVGVVSSNRAGEESSTRFQGYHGERMLFVLEESAGIRHSVVKAIENTCTMPHQNQIIAVGNPDSQTDALHEFCMKEIVEHIIISGFDHPNVVLQDHIIKGAVTQESIDIRKEEYGEESNFYKSRVRGISPSESIDSLVKKAWIDACTFGHTKFKHDSKRQVNELKDGLSMDAIGIDVANSIDGDKACVVMGEQNICNYINEFQCPDASHLAYNFVKEDWELQELGYQIYSLPKLSNMSIWDNNIGVDAVGVGVSTVNTFRNEGVNCIPLQGGQVDAAIPKDAEEKPLYSFTGLRSQMYFTAAMDLQKGAVVLDLPPDILRQLIRELTIITYKVTPRGIQVLDKEEIKKLLGGKSPNVGDAFVYWNFMRHNYYKGDEHLPFA